MVADVPSTQHSERRPELAFEKLLPDTLRFIAQITIQHQHPGTNHLFEQPNSQIVVVRSYVGDKPWLAGLSFERSLDSFVDSRNRYKNRRPKRLCKVINDTFNPHGRFREVGC